MQVARTCNWRGGTNRSPESKKPTRPSVLVPDCVCPCDDEPGSPRTRSFIELNTNRTCDLPIPCHEIPLSLDRSCSHVHAGIHDLSRTRSRFLCYMYSTAADDTRTITHAHYIYHLERHSLLRPTRLQITVHPRKDRAIVLPRVGALIVRHNRVQKEL